MVVLFALLSQITGGWEAVVTSAGPAGKFSIFNLATDLHVTYTLWAGLVGGVALTLATHGTDQFLVQRLLAARSQREAGLGLVLSGIIVFAQFALFLVIGAMLFVYYQQTPPALNRNDEILPVFIINTLHGGAAGFIVAAIVAAALSPSLNAMAAVTANDFYKRFVRPNADDATLLKVARQATIGWGVVQLAVAIGAQWIDRSVLDSGLAVLSLAAGPVLGAFLVGTLTRSVGSRAMLMGMIAGIAVVTWVWHTSATAWTWFAFVGAAVTVVVALAMARVLREPAVRELDRQVVRQ
jgi:Na+/proline symporter